MENSLQGFEKQELERITDEHGTPVFVYNLDQIRSNISRLKQAFRDWTIKFSAKSNINQDVIQTVQDEGLGIVCGSPQEIRRLQRLGVPAKDIQYVAVQPSKEAIETLTNLDNQSKLSVSIESLGTLQRLIENNFAGEATVRINSNYLTDQDSFTSKNAKFGLSPESAVEAFNLIEDSAINPVSMYCHTGKMKTEHKMSLFYEALQGLSTFLKEKDVPVSTVNVGGGLSVQFTDELEPDLENVKDRVEEIFADQDISFVIEPGRYIVSNAGVTLTTVTETKQTPPTRVVSVDIPAHHIPLNSCWDEKHLVKNISRNEKDIKQSVSGPSCTAHTGYHILDEEFTKAERDDTLVITKTGAYGHYLGSTFHSMPKPKIVVQAEGETWLSRREESLEEIMQQEV